jgi:KipI family sensor histidine kinase inhibitor
MASLTADPPALVPLGDRAWTIAWDSDIDIQVNMKVMSLANAVHDAVHQGDLHGITDVVPAFCALTVFYDPEQVDANDLKRILERLVRATSPAPTSVRQWRLPVCFDAAWAPDLADLAAFAGMTEPQVCDTIVQTTLRCHAMGFLPGFAYLASLPPALHMPRLATPRTHVPAQTLAVAAGMAAVYPTVSPGGWRLIGQMPVPLFDARDAVSPALLSPGDDVSFYAVSSTECEEITQALMQDPASRWRYASGVAP